jgi:hypothetical protein
MVLMAGDGTGPARMTVWQCIGCGKIEGPQPCIGVCQDRRVEMVYASEHDEALRETDQLRQRIASLEALVRQIATTTPREGEWERGYRALQTQARRLLPVDPAPSKPPER